MKKFIALFALAFIGFALVGCQAATESQISYEDGTYRGVYIDGSEVQVVVQFSLEDNIVVSASYRTLAYSGVNYRTSDVPSNMEIKEQYEQALQYLVGKDIRDTLVDLYNPADLDIVGFTGASIRSNKTISAIRDALNRGVYSYPSN